MLKDMKHGKEQREREMRTYGYPAYTTGAGKINILINI